jgi:hypothetical protein
MLEDFEMEPAIIKSSTEKRTVMQVHAYLREKKTAIKGLIEQQKLINIACRK